METFQALSPQDKIKVQISGFVARDKCGWLACFLFAPPPRASFLSLSAHQASEIIHFWAAIGLSSQPLAAAQFGAKADADKAVAQYTVRVTLFTFMLGNKDTN